jgi:hypothetical protein
VLVPEQGEDDDEDDQGDGDLDDRDDEDDEDEPSVGSGSLTTAEPAYAARPLNKADLAVVRAPVKLKVRSRHR